MIASASLLGFVFGFLRIAWIIVASIFLYNVAVETGQFQVMKESIASLSSDRRLQVVLIAFCFGAFLEGTGGGGAPVAIAGSFLIGLGFPPFQAATVCLLANTAPVAWGGVGNPIRVLAGVTGLPEHALNAMTGRILPPFSLILPIWLVRSMTGWKETLEVLPALLVAGGRLRDHAVLLVELRGDEPRRHRGRRLLAAGHGRLPEALASADRDDDGGDGERCRGAAALGSRRAQGWSPFVLASILIFLWALARVQRPSEARGAQLSHARSPQRRPANPAGRARAHAGEPAVMDLNALALPGTAVFAGGLLAAPLLGMSLRRALPDPRPDLPPARPFHARHQLHGRAWPT